MNHPNERPPDALRSQAEFRDLAADFRDLAVLEVIVGGGTCLAAFVIYPLSLSSVTHPGLSDIVMIVAQVAVAIGVVAVTIGYLRSRTPARQSVAVSVGIIGFGCLVAVFGIMANRSIIGLLVLLCCGVFVLVTGMRTWRLSRGSRVLQTLLFVFLIAGLGYLFIVIGQGYRFWSHRIVWVGIAALLSVSPIRILILLQHPHSKALFSNKGMPRDAEKYPKFLGIGVKMFITIFLVLWILMDLSILINLFNAVQRGRQKRTLADIRGISISLEEYALDHKGYPAAKTIEELAKLLEPKYIGTLPTIDGWGRPLEYYRIVISSSGVDGVVIRSAGK